MQSDSTGGAATCYREVVVEDFYDMFEICKTSQPHVVVDIGANIGMFTVLMSLLAPNATIYSYEPNPEAYSWLQQNARGERFCLRNCAVSDTAGHGLFDAGDDSTLGKLSKSGSLRVEIIEPSEVAKGQSIDCLKMDCEGAEWEILRDGDLIQRSKRICMEYHVRPNCGLIELERLLRRGGHQILKAEPHSHGQSGVLISTKV